MIINRVARDTEWMKAGTELGTLDRASWVCMIIVWTEEKKNDACCVCWLVGCCSGGGSCSSIKWISLNGWRRLSATRLCWFAWLAGWLADWRKSKSFVIWIWNRTVGGIDQTGRSITQRTTLVLTERLGEERKKNWRGKKRNGENLQSITQYRHIFTSAVQW